MDKWTTIEPSVWKPEKEGDNIIGILVNKELTDEQSGLSARYYLETKDGMSFVWGCAVLDDRMQYVKVGAKVRITYEGGTKNKRNQKVNLYKAEVAEKTEPETTDSKVVSDESEKIEQRDSVK